MAIPSQYCRGHSLVFCRRHRTVQIPMPSIGALRPLRRAPLLFSAIPLAEDLPRQEPHDTNDKSEREGRDEHRPAGFPSAGRRACPGPDGPFDRQPWRKRPTTRIILISLPLYTCTQPMSTIAQPTIMCTKLIGLRPLRVRSASGAREVSAWVDKPIPICTRVRMNSASPRACSSAPALTTPGHFGTYAMNGVIGRCVSVE